MEEHFIRSNNLDEIVRILKYRHAYDGEYVRSCEVIETENAYERNQILEKLENLGIVSVQWKQMPYITLTSVNVTV